MMREENKLIIAIVLSMLLVFTYQGYMTKFHKKPQANQTKEDKAVSGFEQKSVADDTVMIRLQKENKQTAEESLIIIENELYRAVLTDATAAIKEYYLIKFRDKEKKPLLLSRPTESQPDILEVDEKIEQKNESLWQLIKNTGDMVIYKKEDVNKIVEKSFTFYKTNYIIELEISIQSKSDLTQDITYRLTGGSGLISHSQVDTVYINAETEIADKVYRRKPSHKKIQGGEIFYGNPGWVVAKGRYYSFVLKPQQPEEAAFIESNDRRTISSGIVVGPIKLAPKDTVKHRFLLYAGPNSLDNLKALGPEATNIIGYGAFNSIGSVMFKLLKFFYKTLHSYGLAIILLAVVISAVLFPLTKKSLSSMKKMQLIQPEIEKIRKEYSDNPQKMNKEVMELYKKHKINPVSGCLPLFLQFPIFIALYQVLARSVELKGARFLWINDLSEPDAVFKLPYVFPIIGGYLNILPILMIAATVIQQKISQPKGAEVTDQQRMMSTIFPIVLGVAFYNMPSGLVLYWFTNTLLMIFIQEVALKSRSPA